jgi:hypothetical protein
MRFLRSCRAGVLAAAFFAFGLPVGLAAALALIPTDARASVSIAVTFEALVKDADAVAVIVPQESQSVWEDNRIYTYTHVKVDQAVAGELKTGGDAYIRTMGGVVNHIGQLVDGEAVFQTGKPSLLFVHKWKGATTYEVSARAQGQFPILVDDASKLRMVRKSGSVGALLAPKPRANEQTPEALAAAGPPPPPPRLASDVMHDRSVDDVAKDIATAWKTVHPAPPASK